ncbi:MAG: hypothetical protein ACLUER_00610 [Odoribacter splanchnicus]
MDIKINKGKVKSAIKQVVVNEMTVQNMVDASRLASATDGPAFMAALLSQICVFDGKQLTYEEVTELPAAVFLELSAALVTSGMLPSEELLSTLSGKDTSVMTG